MSQMNLRVTAENLERALMDAGTEISERIDPDLRLSELIIKTNDEGVFDWDFEMFYLGNKSFFWTIPEEQIKACWLAIKLDGTTPGYRGVAELVRMVS